MKYIGDIFYYLLNTSTTWVDIFWMSLNLAKESFQECIVFLMMEYVSLNMEISLSFVYVNSSQAHIGSLLYKWYIHEDMMPFGGEYVMICKRSCG